MKKNIIVDVENHVLPPEFVSIGAESGTIDMTGGDPVVRWRGISFRNERDFLDVDYHMEVCRQAGLTHIMLHQAMLATMGNEMVNMPTTEVSRRHNDSMAGIRDRYPDLVFPYGTVKPHDQKEAVKEAERCIDELGFKAMSIDSSYGTSSLVHSHTVETYDFWELVNDREIPVFMHPGFLAYGWEWMDKYKLEETVGRDADTALCLAFMIHSGLFDRFPKLKLLVAHMGGAFTMILPRLQFGHRLGYEGFLNYQKPVNTEEPAFYAKRNIWVNTMGFDAPGIKHAVEVYGVDHVLLGTDYGPVPISPKEHIDIVRNECGLSEADREKVLGLNAVEFFNLPV